MTIRELLHRLILSTSILDIMVVKDLGIPAIIMPSQSHFLFRSPLKSSYGVET
jgi:hypothetical protein